MKCYYQSKPLNSLIVCEMLHHLQFCNIIGVTILECQQSTNSTKHYVSVSRNLPTLKSLLKRCLQNVFKTFITKHGV